MGFFFGSAWDSMDMEIRNDSPFTVFVHVRVRLHGILFDQEFDALIEGCRYRWWLLTQQHLNWIVGGQTHYVLGTNRMRTTFTVGTIGHAVCGLKWTMELIRIYSTREMVDSVVLRLPAFYGRKGNAKLLCYPQECENNELQLKGEECKKSQMTPKRCNFDQSPYLQIRIFIKFAFQTEFHRPSDISIRVDTASMLCVWANYGVHLGRYTRYFEEKQL